LFFVGTSFGADFVCATLVQRKYKSAVRMELQAFFKARDAEVFLSS
jgi:hypothetical protein